MNDADKLRRIEELRRRKAADEAELRELEAEVGVAPSGSVSASDRSLVFRDAKDSYFITGDNNRVSLDGRDPEVLFDYYRRWLGSQCGRLPLGLIDDSLGDRQPRIGLPDVYVPLDVTASPRPPEEEGEDERRLWVGRLARGEVGGRAPALDALASAEARRFVLLGDAGSGKTTFGHWVCRELATADGEVPGALTGVVPLRFVLRKVAALLRREGGRATIFWEALKADAAEALGDAGAARVVAYIQERLPDVGGFVVFDGLDEVPESLRSDLVAAIDDFAALIAGERSRFLVTARPYAYTDPSWRLPGFEVLALAPFTAEQAERFVGRWYQAIRGSYGWREDEAEARAEKLRRALRDPARPYLADLASRPLLLTLMATVHCGDGQLPEGRADLYERSVKLLLDRWQRARTVEVEGQAAKEPSLTAVLGIGEARLHAALERLALAIHERQRGEGAESVAEPASITRQDLLAAFDPLLGTVAPQTLIDYLRDRAGLLIERVASKEYAFPHRSFQEFLAASALVRIPEPQREFRRRLDEDPRFWRETVLLGLGKLKLGGLGGAVGALHALMPREPTWTDLRDETRLRTAVVVALAVEELGVGTAGEDDYRAIVDRTRTWLTKIVERGLLPPKERLEAGDLLGRLGDRRKGVGVRVTKRGATVPDVDWVEIPAGSFLMGCQDDDEQAWDDEKPQHPVELERYWIARYPVTNAQFAPFVEGGGYDRREWWTEAGWEWRQGAEADVSLYSEEFRETARDWLARRPREKRDRPFFWDHPRLAGGARPVVGVTWFEALAYARWLAGVLRAADALPPAASAAIGSLPTEAQWERAARGTAGRPWPWGKRFEARRCNSEEGGLEEPSTVGMFPAGKSPDRLFDCAGNVWEWTATIWSRSDAMPPDFEYPYRADDGREDSNDASLRVVRGGSYYSNSRYARCAARIRYIPDYFNVNFGFRVVLSLASSEY